MYGSIIMIPKKKKPKPWKAVASKSDVFSLRVHVKAWNTRMRSHSDFSKSDEKCKWCSMMWIWCGFERGNDVSPDVCTGFKRGVGSVLRCSLPSAHFTQRDLWWLCAWRISLTLYLPGTDALLQCSPYLFFCFFFFLHSHHYFLFCEFNYTFLNEPSMKKACFPPINVTWIRTVPPWCTFALL